MSRCQTVLVERSGPTTVCVRRPRTFSGIYDGDELYSRPSVIIDEISRLYQEGVRHVLYLAEAPYSRQIHLTRDSHRVLHPPGAGTSAARDGNGGPTSTAAPAGAGAGAGDEAAARGAPDDTGDGLFFLSPVILARCLERHEDLNIYPVFRDDYSAIRFREPRARALYIQDVGELLKVVNDQTQRMAVFLNLFSGEAGVKRRGPGGEDDTHYNGVVSYATLLNVYGGIVNERALRAALIHDDTGHNQVKNLLVLYLSLFHLARYHVGRREIALKLDPFPQIIGEASVGRLAARQHIRLGPRFNYLAFLTEVRNATRARATRAPTDGAQPAGAPAAQAPSQPERQQPERGRA